MPAFPGLFLGVVVLSSSLAQLPSGFLTTLAFREGTFP
jgi:hypothetical protein